jgi:hypothetical protein
LGSSVHDHTPNINITNYTDENIKNISSNNSSYEKTAAIGNSTGRLNTIMHSFTYFIRDMSYQVYAMGMEFGFDKNWIPPMAFALGALTLMIFYFVSDNLSVLLIPIAIGIIAKDWISERLK